MAEFKNMVLGFIGAGNMNGAILSGVLKQGIVMPDKVWLSNRHQEKLLPLPPGEYIPQWITHR